MILEAQALRREKRLRAADHAKLLEDGADVRLGGGFDDLQRIESNQGRLRPYQNAPRSLDLDLLLYGDLVLNDVRLKLPHPRMHQPAFVMVPLAELEPELYLPGLGELRVLLAQCPVQPIELLAGPEALLQRASAQEPAHQA